jgi:hypothetical protein
MMKSTSRIAVLSLLAGALVSLPTQLPAQTTNKTTTAKSAPVEKKAPGTKGDSAASEKKKSPHAFHGKLAAVDKKARTIQVGKSIYQVNTESKIKKDGKPATLEDGVLGEPVSGYVKPSDDGKMVAATLNFGAKTDAKGKK